MSPIWIDFALAMGFLLLLALIGIPIVLCRLDSREGPRILHEKMPTVTTRQLSIREIADSRARHECGINTGIVKQIDGLYEMVHGNKHEG